MTDTDPKQQALTYIVQALNDYSLTLATSVRGPFLREAQAAIKALEPEAKADKAE